MTKRYAAMVGKDVRITSILADSMTEAQKAISASLDRPGRRQLYLRWVREGRRLMEVIRGEQGKAS